MGKYARVISQCCEWRFDLLMIFVTLGSQDKPFNRLLKKIDELIECGLIKEEVIVQAGPTDYQSSKMKIIDFLPIDEFNNYISKSEFVIAHAGVGSILDCLKKNKKVIAVARLAKYGEIANDHQLEIIDEFTKLGFIIGCKDVDDLEKCLKDIKSFNPKKFVSNNQKFVDLIDEYLQR